MEYDAIIIGAGLNALVCANYLVLENKNILILEKNTCPCGSASSFIRGRFEFSPFVEDTKASFWHETFKNLNIQEEKFFPLPECFHLISFEKDISKEYILPKGEEEFINKMEDYVKGSRKSIEKLLIIAKEIKEAISNLDNENIDSKTYKKKYKNFLKFSSLSVNEAFYSLNIPFKAQQILSAFWLLFNLPLSKLDFVSYILLLLDYIEGDRQIYCTRNYGLSMSLLNNFQQLKGKILYNSEVEEILTKEGYIYGVRLSNGKEYYTKNIISNLNPTLVYGKMFKNIDLSEGNKFTNFNKINDSAFCLHLGLNRSIDQLNINSYSYYIYESLNSEEEYKKMTNNLTNNIIVTCPNIVISDYSPKGTTILEFRTTFLNDIFANQINEDNYFKLKEELALKYIEIFEKSTGITIKDYIEEIEVSTPVTYARYTNSINGSINGYAQTKSNSYISRLLTMKEEGTKGLRFCYDNCDCAQLTLKDMEGDLDE